MMEIEWNGVELEPKEWHKHLEGLLTYGTFNPDVIPYLNDYQRYTVNEIKKTFKRIKYRERGYEVSIHKHGN